MPTLAELDSRLTSLEGLLATTKRLRELTLTQTQNPATVLSGGVFAFNGGNFTIPNVADGINPQDVATVNQIPSRVIGGAQVPNAAGAVLFTTQTPGADGILVPMQGNLFTINSDLQNVTVVNTNFGQPDNECILTYTGSSPITLTVHYLGYIQVDITSANTRIGLGAFKNGSPLANFFTVSNQLPIGTSPVLYFNFTQSTLFNPTDTFKLGWFYANGVAVTNALIGSPSFLVTT